MLRMKKKGEVSYELVKQRFYSWLFTDKMGLYLEMLTDKTPYFRNY